MVDPSRAAGAALKTLAEAAGYPVHLGTPTTPDDQQTFPHLVWWVPPLHRGNPDLEQGPPTVLSGTIQLTAVGRDTNEVLAALDRTAAVLVGQRPTIAGYDPAPLWQVPLDTPVRVDPLVRTENNRPIYIGIAQYNLYATHTEGDT